MKLMINIPDKDIPPKQGILDISVHFIDGKVCECDYPFTQESETDILDKIRAEIDSYCSDNRDRNDGLYIAMRVINKYRREK